MPEEETTRDVPDEPREQAAWGGPLQGGSSQSPPSPPANQHPASSEQEAAELKKIATGEGWLIFVGAVSICVNLLLGFIYYLQLGQMTEATKASAKAAETAAETLQTTSSQFDRGQRQSIDQTVASITAADSATRAAKNAELFFRTDERAWVEIGKIEKTSTSPADPPFGAMFKFSFFPQNIGKTVANNVRLHVKNVDGDMRFDEGPKLIRMWQDDLFQGKAKTKSFVWPDTPGPHDIAPGEISPFPSIPQGRNL